MLKNKLAIYFPSTKRMIDVVFELAEPKSGDVLFDLGSGDGRIILEAAKIGIPAVGIEKNLFLVWVSRRKLRNFKNIKIVHGDIFDQDIGKATIIVAYLSRQLTYRLQKKILDETKKGTKIILIDHPFKSWEPVKIKKVGITPVRLYLRS